MAPRSSWKGFIKLSLVSVPVRAFTANDTSKDIRLNQLHKDCNSRVKYQKVCPEHGELPSDQIVSGYEYTKGEYVVVDPKEVAKLRPDSDRGIHIEGFIDPSEIDSLYHSGRTYFLLPDGVAGNRPYALLHQGMIDGNVHALARMVLSNREQLVLLRPEGELLVVTILSYAHNVKAKDEFIKELPQQELSKEELSLTTTLIQASKLDEFEFDSYKDHYVDQLTQLIQMKIDGQEVVQVSDPEEPKIINLMDALKKSVAEAQVGRKMAPSAPDTETDEEEETEKKGKKKSSRKKTG